jgi:MFS family permease
VSLIYAAGFIGALSPTLAGILADAYGLKTTFILASCLVGLSAVTLMVTALPKARVRLSG